MMQLVEMNEMHVKQIAELEKQCFSDPWSERSIASELSNPLSLWLVCMDGETLAGYVGSQTVMGESDMMNLAVAPSYRRRGIGEALVNSLVERLALRNAHCLTLEVRASNQAAISLYQKQGFREIGLRPRYYRNPREDALILRKEWLLEHPCN